jgi:hypothetical protein
MGLYFEKNQYIPAFGHNVSDCAKLKDALMGMIILLKHLSMGKTKVRIMAKLGLVALTRFYC